MPTSNQDAICLHRRESGEHDFLVAFLTVELGKLTAVARGARKPRAANLAACQPGTRARIQLAWSGGRPGRLPTLTQADVVPGRQSPAPDYAVAVARAYLLELVDLALPDPDPHPELFHLLADGLGGVTTAAQPELVLFAFELALLGELGFDLVLDHCVACDRPLSEEAVLFAAPSGGLLHADHGSPPGSFPISADAVRALRRLAQPAAYGLDLSGARLSAQLTAEVRRASRAAISAHLDLTPRSWQVLDSVLIDQPSDR